MHVTCLKISLIEKEIKHQKNPNRDFDGYVLVNPMLVIEIDAINAEPLQTCLASFPHIFRMTNHHHFAIFIKFGAKFRCQLNFFSNPPLKRLFPNKSSSILIKTSRKIRGKKRKEKI